MGERERFFSQLQYDGYSGKRYADSDVSISRALYNNESGGIGITIRGGKHKLLAHTSERLLFAIFKNRIIIRESEMGVKYNVRNGVNSDTAYCKFRPRDYTEWEKFIGDYELKYDELYDYYYVEVKGGGNIEQRRS